MEEFYRLLIRAKHVEENKEKVAHYLSGLQPNIQKELSLVRMTSIEEAYQFSLRVEEKLNKKYEGRQRGCSQGERGGNRSTGGQNETQKKNEDVGTSRYQRNEDFNHSRDQNFGDQRGRGRGCGQGSGRGGFCGTFCHCNEEGHHAFKCP